MGKNWWEEDPRETLAPVAQPVKTLVKAAGGDDQTANIASAAVDPSSLIRAGSPKPIRELGTSIKGTMNDGKPTHTINDAQIIQRPTMPQGAAATTLTLPDALKGATIRTVAGPQGPSFVGSQQAVGLQSGLASDLALQARGQGPSVAGKQFEQAQAANTAATFAMMASQRGGPSAAGGRQAMQTSADIQAKTAQDAALARMQEQLNAQGQLAGVTSQMRGGDIAEQSLVQNAELTRYKGELDAAVAQGTLDQRTAETLYKSKMDKALFDANAVDTYNKRVDDYVRMGLSVDEANQRAGIDVDRIRAGIPNTPSSFDQLMKGVQTVAPLATSFMGGPPIPPAAPAQAAPMSLPSSAPSIDDNRYRNTTDRRTQY